MNSSTVNMASDSNVRQDGRTRNEKASFEDKSPQFDAEISHSSSPSGNSFTQEEPLERNVNPTAGRDGDTLIYRRVDDALQATEVKSVKYATAHKSIKYPNGSSTCPSRREGTPPKLSGAPNTSILQYKLPPVKQGLSPNRVARKSILPLKKRPFSQFTCLEGREVSLVGNREVINGLHAPPTAQDLKIKPVTLNCNRKPTQISTNVASAPAGKQHAPKRQRSATKPISKAYLPLKKRISSDVKALPKHNLPPKKRILAQVRCLDVGNDGEEDLVLNGARIGSAVQEVASQAVTPTTHPNPSEYPTGSASDSAGDFPDTICLKPGLIASIGRDGEVTHDGQDNMAAHGLEVEHVTPTTNRKSSQCVKVSTSASADEAWHPNFPRSWITTISKSKLQPAVHLLLPNKTIEKSRLPPKKRFVVLNKTVPNSKLPFKKRILSEAPRRDLRIGFEREVFRKRSADVRAEVDSTTSMQVTGGRQGTESARTFQCEDCMISFRERSAVEKHKVAVHEGRRPFWCQESGCEMEYKTRGDLTRHWRSAHLNERPAQCVSCGKTFTRWSTLKRHCLRIHSTGLKKTSSEQN